MIRILIADDHAIVRKGLKEIIVADSDNMCIAGEADNFGGVIKETVSGDYDILVMDINMPSGNALDTIKQLRQSYPDLPILILSIYPENQYAVRMIKAGASGYLTKNSAPEDLVAAIARISSGEVYVSQTVGRQLMYDLMNSADGRLPHEMLSDREYQVFRRLAFGKTVQVIADELNLSKQTISTYRGRILEKMNMKSNSDFVSYAIRNELME